MTRIRFAAAAVLAAVGLGTTATAATSAHAATGPHVSARATTQNLRVVTANVDFATTAAHVQSVWENQIAPNADVAFLQEVKNVRLGAFIDSTRWIVLHGSTTNELQNWNSDGKGSAKLGTAVVIRRSAISGSLSDYALVKGVDGGWGCKKLSPTAYQIQTRWITKVKLHLANGRYVRLSSLHMPPARCAAPMATADPSPYFKMAENVVSFVKLSTMPTILGADWNKPILQDPNGIAAKTNLRVAGLPSTVTGSRIDGFMYGPNLSGTGVRKLGTPSSGHSTVQLTVAIPAP
jgi:hypothetical protein